MSSSVGIIIPNTWTKKCSKPPTTKKSPSLMGKSTISMAIFNSFLMLFVCSPEGKPYQITINTWNPTLNAKDDFPPRQVRQVAEQGTGPQDLPKGGFNQQSLWEFYSLLFKNDGKMMENHGEIMGKIVGESPKQWDYHIYGWFHDITIYYNLSLASGNLTVCHGKWMKITHL